MPMGEDDGVIRCELCGRQTPTQQSYVVTVEVYADPSMPAVSAEEVEAMDLDKTMEQLLAEMEHLTAEDLLDQVHRKFEYRICTGCQPKFLANPMGLPRRWREGEN